MPGVPGRASARGRGGGIARRVDAEAVVQHWMTLPLQERIQQLRWTDHTLVQRVRDVRQALVQSELACLRYGFCCHEEEGLPAVKLSLDDFNLGTESSEEAFWARSQFIDSDRFIETVKMHLSQEPQRAQRAKILGSTPNSWQEFEFQLLRLVALKMIDNYQEETAIRSAAEFDDSAGAWQHQFEEELFSSIERGSAKKSKAKRSAKRCSAERKMLNTFNTNLTVGQQEDQAEDDAATGSDNDLGGTCSIKGAAFAEGELRHDATVAQEEDQAEDDAATGSDNDLGSTCPIKGAAFAEGELRHVATVAQEELDPTTTTASEVGSQDLQEVAPTTSTTSTLSELGSQVERPIDTLALYPQAQLVFQTRLRRPRSLQRGWRTPDPSPERAAGTTTPRCSGWQLCIGGAVAEPGNDDMGERQIEVRESRSVYPTQLRMPSRTPSPSQTSVRYTHQPTWAPCTEKVPTPRGEYAIAELRGMPGTMFPHVDYEKQGDMQSAFSIPPVPWVFVPVPINIPQTQAPGTWLTEESVAASKNHCSEHLSLVDDYSIGSAGHPHSCAAACKYARKQRGCKEGRMCDRCHLCTWRKGGTKEPQAQAGGPSRRSRAVSDEACSSWGC